ncbi:MAG TPA: hypothetical protein VHK01_14165, partial [Lacipirellulaceae bacterium]|nr:hypothetical protein [Lacipirellulaceae bacterium]
MFTSCLAFRPAFAVSNKSGATSVLAIGIISLSLGAARAVAEEATTTKGKLPRYDLKLGQELHYSAKGTFKYDSGSFDS